MRLRHWPLTALFLILACGRTGLGTAHQAPAATHSPGVADASGSPGDTGGAADAFSGPCGDATCLSSLFQTCVPTGRCRRGGGGGPSAVALDACYANGITVAYVSERSGNTVTATLSVRRGGSPCYTIQETSGGTVSAINYVISGPSGDLATAVTADKSGSISVTCQGRQPVLVNSACLRPVSTSPESCDLEACP